MAAAGMMKQNVEIGSGLHPSDDLVITGDGQVVFEDDVICGAGVRVFAEGRDIRIGARAWLGDNTEIRASIGANTIIVSNSVVTDDVPANVVMDGNPATHIWQVC